GEASLNEARTSLALSNHDPYTVDWQPLLQRLQSEGTTWVATSPVPADFAYSGFAYPFGLEVARDVFRDHRTAGLDTLWTQPPTSARQVMRWPTPAAPTADLGADAIPALPGTHVLIDADRMGAFVFRVFLLRVAVLSLVPVRPDDDTLTAMATTLRGDHLSIFRFQSPVGPQAFIAWRLRFDDETSAATIAAFLESARARTWQVRRAGGDVVLFASTGEVPQVTRWRAPVFSASAVGLSAGGLGRASAISHTRLFCRHHDVWSEPAAAP
ncbi:MAG TPA: hypothetical protein VGF45_09635, partial [Polyangia bacterium]